MKGGSKKKTYRRKNYKRKTYKRKTYKRKTYKRKTYKKSNVKEINKKRKSKKRKLIGGSTVETDSGGLTDDMYKWLHESSVGLGGSGAEADPEVVDRWLRESSVGEEADAKRVAANVFSRVDSFLDPTTNPALMRAVLGGDLDLKEGTFTYAKDHRYDETWGLKIPKKLKDYFPMGNVKKTDYTYPKGRNKETMKATTPGKFKFHLQ
jgi:hypothetical protein